MLYKPRKEIFEVLEVNSYFSSRIKYNGWRLIGLCECDSDVIYEGEMFVCFTNQKKEYSMFYYKFLLIKIIKLKKKSQQNISYKRCFQVVYAPFL